MDEDDKKIWIGDKMRLQVSQVETLQAKLRGTSLLVEVYDIVLEKDGTKTLVARSAT